MRCLQRHRAGTGQSESLVAIDQGMVAGDGMQERGSLELEGGIGVLPEYRGAWSTYSRLEQADIPDGDVADSRLGDPQEVVKVEVSHLLA